MHQLLPMANQVCCCATIAAVVVAAGLGLPPFAVGDLLGHECGDTGTSTDNNYVDMLLNWLTESAASSYPYFAISTSGNEFGAVHAIALCRGDADSSDCIVCLSAASQEVRTLCPSYSEATIYHDVCHISYSEDSTFIAPTSRSAELAGAGTPTFTEPSFPGWNPNGDVHAANAIRRFVRASLEDTARWAAYNASDRFATGRVDGGSHGVTDLYTLAQCTPDMVAAECWDCLDGLLNTTMKEFAGRQGGWRMSVRCSCQYETYPFYGGAATLLNGWPDVAASAATDQDFPSIDGYVTPTAMPPGEPHKLVSDHGASRSGTVLKITIPITSAILALSVFCFYMKRRRQQAGTPSLPYPVNQEDIQIMESLILDLSTLKAATNNFEECNKLGEGGFGVVYKGVLPNGQVIAVKRLSHTSQQGIDELKNEIILVGNLQHRNLVRLVGVSFQEEKLLVYEYMPNRSLDTILFNRDRSNELDWEKRFKIINEIARGLQYLHEESRLKIIHRDLKANNILLDSNLSPKISDFGLAKLFEGDQSHVVTNRVAGTYGYMAPEYAMHGRYSVKSDVFSFGVIVLEIVTGRRSTGSYNNEQSVSLLGLIWQHWTMGTVVDLIDPSLLSSSSIQCSDDRDQMLRCMHIGLLCVQENPADRPMLSSVILMLKGSSATPLRAPTRLAFWVHSADDAPPRYSSSGGELVAASPNHVSVTELEAR